MKQSLILLPCLFLATSLMAGGKHKGQEWTKEQREAMAKSHEQLAVCLRSDKTMDVCHEEMMKSCKESDTCPMKGRMGMHHGKHEGKETSKD